MISWEFIGKVWDLILRCLSFAGEMVLIVFIVLAFVGIFGVIWLALCEIFDR